MTSAAIYVRISDDREGAGLGVDRQDKDCRELAQRLGWTINETYVDNDVSAYDRRKKRPAWSRLLADLTAGTHQAVLAWHPDRMYRRMTDLLDLIDLTEREQLSIATVTAGAIDLSTPTGRAVAKTVAAWSEHESEHKADRTRRKHLEIAQAGKPSGGLRAFGYAPDRLTLVPDEAAVIRETAQRVLVGESLRGVCADLNARQVPTVTGVPWHPTVLRAMLMRARYAGLREHRGVTYPATWPAILAMDTHLALRQLFTADGRRTSSGTARVHLLAGIVRCCDCDAPMVLHVGGHHRPVNSRRAYTCRPCRHYVAQPGTDDKVIGGVLLRLADEALLEALEQLEDQGGNSSADQQIIDEGVAELERIGRELADRPGVPATVVTAMSGKVQERVDAARARIASRARKFARMPQLRPLTREAWDALPLPVRRAFVEVLTERIVIRRPARGGRVFDPARVDVTWRV